MRSVAFLGAGQAGLQLGTGRLDVDDVRVVSNRIAEQIGNGPVTSSSVLPGALRPHRRLGVWNEQCPRIGRVSLTTPDENASKALSWASRLHLPAQSADQRVELLPLNLRVHRALVVSSRYGMPCSMIWPIAHHTELSEVEIGQVLVPEVLEPRSASYPIRLCPIPTNCPASRP